VPPPTRVRAALAAITLAFCLLGAVPYVIGAVRTPSGSRFTGLVYNDYDQEYYLASQRSAAEGLRSNRFSSEPHAPGPVAELYPLIGRIGSWTGIPPVVLYHAARVAAGVALPTVVFVLMALCFPNDRRQALEATALAVFTTGLGTLAPDVFSWRTGGDLVVVEATALRSATLFPHFAVAYLGITACLIAVVVAVREARPVRSAAWGAAGGLLLAVSHTFLLLPLGVTLAVCAAWTGLRWARGRAPVAPLVAIVAAGVSILVPAIPSLLALRHEMARFESIQGKPFQSTPSDQWVSWLAVYALLLPFALLGLWAWRRVRRPGLGILLTALLVDFVLVFAPVTPFQRRFSEGAIIPLAALAACGIAAIPRARLALLGTVLAMAALGAGRLGTSARYLPRSDWQAFDRIGRSDVVLSGDRLGAAIPAFSDGTVYIARSVETMHYREKGELRAAFAADPVSPAFDALRAAGVNLIVSDRDDPTFAVPPERFPPACFPRVATLGPLTMYRPAATCPVGPLSSR
jgi:hypothetical protein